MKYKKNIKRDLEIPFTTILPYCNGSGLLITKCKEIIGILTSEFFGFEEQNEECLKELGLACEKYLNEVF